ncbi:RNA polymerase recycling motor ATPase HelR [Brevibacterium sp. FAM 25378]|uniref:RNA polymerase recycling motor ATPase HelR n=1 Tax=unclassified Brevibacterium TaxID=2614124 RepID=UPI001092C4D6|nr:RNA polymerase recycling motor ATPase HelR [Brevibacterium sp. S22]TGD27968.1 AAA family ATPase [Brevibacterium sp. S22]
MPATVFDLPSRLSAKTTADLIAADDQHFARIASQLDREAATLEARLADLRRSSGGGGEAALERDTAIHRLSSELNLLRRFDLDVCLGRMVFAESGDTVYIGRIGLRDEDGRALLIDWRTPMAKPFFAATLASPMGLSTRRRYRWANGLISDYWDERFTSATVDDTASLDDQSAFIASLGTSRSAKMHDVLSTIQTDQDAIIRAPADAPMVVDGGPGTGKTVVALHRAAYLLYSDPSIVRGGGLLFIGPNHTYLSYVDDVLPRLGEDGVRLCTLDDLIQERPTDDDDDDSTVLKANLNPGAVIDRAVSIYEEPPTTAMVIDTVSGDLTVTPGDWAAAFTSIDADVDHNSARDQIWDELLEILTESVVDADEDAEPLEVRRFLSQDPDLRATLTAVWPILDPLDIVGDLWSVPAYLSLAAPDLTETETACLQRAEPRAWTKADVPLIDAARRRIGDPADLRRRRRAASEAAAEQARMADVVDDLIAADDSELMQMTMLKGDDLRGALDNPSGRETPSTDRLAGPFGHIIVDEAQELTDAQWHMLLDRCPSKSFTIVGDRAQARHGFAQSWDERMSELGLTVNEVHLSINYRTPAEVMAAAEPVIRAVLPHANVPQSVRDSGSAVGSCSVDEVSSLAGTWLDSHREGTVCVITVSPAAWSFAEAERVSVMAPAEVKGLEFDLVILVDPDGFGTGIQGGVDRYVSMTRATAELVIATDGVPPSRQRGAVYK